VEIMANSILDALGLSSEDIDKRIQKARDVTDDYINQATYGPPAVAPDPTAPARIDVDPNIPNKSGKDDLDGPDYSKFFANLPPELTQDQKFQAFQKDAAANGTLTNPNTFGPLSAGIDFKTGLPKSQDDAFQNATLDAFTNEQNEKQRALASDKSSADKDLDEARAQYQSTVDKYLKAGLTPPPMPDALKQLMYKDQVKPEELGKNDSIFGAVSGKYQDLQKDGRIGADATGGRGPAGAGTGAAKATGTPGESSAKAQEKDYLGNLLSKIYGSDLGDEAIKNAQQSRSTQELIGGLGKAFQGAGAALSMGRVGAGIKADTSGADAVINNADSQVKDIMQRRDAKMKGIETGIKANDLVNAAKMRDPDSDVSKAYRNLAAQLNPKLAMMPDFDKMTAEGIKQTEPMVDMSIRVQALNLQRQMMKEDKEKVRLDKAEADVSNKIEQLYGGRGANARPYNIRQSADRLLGYAAQFANRDNLTKQEVELLVKDMGQIMSGGVATEGSSKRIMPETVSSKWHNLMQNVLNQPTGANLGAFVHRLENAATEMKDLAYKNEMENVNTTLRGYKSSLRPEFYKELHGKYNAEPGSPGPSGKIKVSNGRETYMIDSKDLAHAKADGFDQVP
jgi:hypothetical protein